MGNRKRTLSAALTAALTAALASAALVGITSTTGGAQAAAPPYLEYVALGDSWSADVVIADLHGLPDDTHVPMGCGQSHANYPKQVAKALGVPTFRDATCGSATTDDFYAPQNAPAGGVNPPQFDRLTPTTDLVTVGIGGNDAGFAGAAVSCINPAIDPKLLLGNKLQPSCKDKFTAGGVDQLAQRIADSHDDLVAAFDEIQRRSPLARVLVIDYLAALPRQGCWPLVPIWHEDMVYLHDTMLKLNAMVQSAAAEAEVEFVDTYTPSLGHHVCTGALKRYVEGLGIVSLNGPAIAVPAHPNQAGADAQARAVLAHLAG